MCRSTCKWARVAVGGETPSLAVNRSEDVPVSYPEPHSDVARAEEVPAKATKADARTRTGDPFITSEVLYQLSYVGRGSSV